MTFLLVILFLAALGISALLCVIVRAAARAAHLVDRPDARKDHAIPVALGGGVAIFAAVSVIVAGAVAAVAVVRGGGALPWGAAVAARYADGVFVKLPALLAFLGGGAVILALGFWDDIRKARGAGMNPWLKLGIQGLAVLPLVWEGMSLSLFVDNRVFGAVVTIFWIVGIANAFNLLDNMNGLSAGVALIAAGLFLAVAVQNGQWFIAGLLTVFAGAVAGFLPFNFPGASLFLGDAGALFLGYFLASSIVLFTFYEAGRTVFSIALPLLVLAVPLFDTVSVVWIRLREGRPVFVGDRRHLSHRLVDLGFSRTVAVLVIYLLTFGAGAAATLLPRLDDVGAIVVLLQAAGGLSIVWLLERRRPE
ncbi:MAG: MraY family glycosyltransferase [Planctomycetota bacterium]